MLRSRITAAAAAFALCTTLASALPASAAAPPTLPLADAQSDVGSLHVLRFGKAGDPIVLLPGLTTGPWEWADLIRRLSPRYTVYAIGLPGFDGRPAATPPLFDRFARDFWTLLDVQKIARPLVIGHSLGGTLAIALAEEHPERLRGVVALEGLPIIPGMERMTAEQRLQTAAQMSAPMALESRDQFLAYEQTYMRGPFGVLDGSLAAPLAEFEARSDPASVAQWLKEDVGGDLRPGLSRITVPLLEIVPYNGPDVAGSANPYTEDQKVAYYRALLNGAPRLQLVPVSPARHFAMYDQPDRVFAIIDAFLNATR